MARGTAQRSSMMNNQPQALPAGHSYGHRISNSDGMLPDAVAVPNHAALIFVSPSGYYCSSCSDLDGSRPTRSCVTMSISTSETHTQGRSRPLNSQAINLSSSTIQESLTLGLLTVSAAVRSTHRTTKLYRSRASFQLSPLSRLCKCVSLISICLLGSQTSLDPESSVVNLCICRISTS